MYQIIYADPPWRYDFSSTKNRKIENQYPTMTPKEISELEVPSEDNSVCFLWATAPKLREALFILESWGFTYKSHAVWDKQIIGMGYWFRGQHELLLVGTKGKFSPPEPGDRRSSIFSSKRGRHSAKPASVREWIDKAYPDCTKLEMFARDTASGWDVWGNEV